MPNFYKMTEKTPCPACGEAHFFKSVPYFEDANGASFEVTCPETRKTIQITIPPTAKQTIKPETEVLCGVCKKRRMVIQSQGNPTGKSIIQYLECPNEMCGYTSTRQVDIITGRVLISSDGR